MGVKKSASVVSRAIVDHDNAQIFGIRSENGSHGLNDHALLVMSGDEHGDAGLRIGHDGAIRAKLFDNGKDTDDHCSAAHEDNAGNEDQSDEHAGQVIDAEDETIGAGTPTLFFGKGEHDLCPSAADKAGNRDEGVALAAQLIDDLRQGDKRLLAFATAVMQKDDIAVVQFAKNVSEDLICGNLPAIDGLPVVSVDLLPDNHIAHVLGNRQVSHFLG